jgi:hypothetical protein
MIFKMDEVLWELSKFYGKKFQAKNPGVEMSANAMAAATLHAMEVTGHAVENISPDGNVTWQATQKFLDSTGLEPGPLVTLEST